MSTPPVLTSERIDAMLSIMAAVCLESVEEAGRRHKAAPDFEEFERSGRALQRACRNLRQTIAMKQRHDREQDRAADQARRRVEAERQDAERRRDQAVARKQAAVEARLDRAIWDEHEQDEALGFCDEAKDRLADAALDPDFLDTPIETLVQRLADDIGLYAEPETPAATPPEPPPERAEVEASPEPVAPPAAISAVEPDAPTVPAAAPEVAGEAPEPPPRPPDPPPEPYVPPWERLAPGQSMPGGAGW